MKKIFVLSLLVGVAINAKAQYDPWMNGSVCLESYKYKYDTQAPEGYTKQYLRSFDYNVMKNYSYLQESPNYPVKEAAREECAKRGEIINNHIVLKLTSAGFTQEDYKVVTRFGIRADRSCQTGEFLRYTPVCSVDIESYKTVFFNQKTAKFTGKNSLASCWNARANLAMIPSYLYSNCEAVDTRSGLGYDNAILTSIEMARPW